MYRNDKTEEGEGEEEEEIKEYYEEQDSSKLGIICNGWHTQYIVESWNHVYICIIEIPIQLYLLCPNFVDLSFSTSQNAYARVNNLAHKGEHITIYI